MRFDTELAGIYKKFYYGDHVTDEELEKLRVLFNRLTNDLLVLGPEYAMARREMLRNLLNVEDYIRNRKDK
jgi:hypothetical protein